MSLTVAKGDSKLHFRIEMPRVDIGQSSGREIFAIWKPDFDQIQDDQFLTDANGFDLMARSVYDD